MDWTDPRISQFIPEGQPNHPLPWHTGKDGEWFTTEEYVKAMLDALAGDERRADLRRVYRFYKQHYHPGNHYQVTAHWTLMEAARQYMHLLPPRHARRLLKSAGTLRRAH